MHVDFNTCAMFFSDKQSNTTEGGIVEGSLDFPCPCNSIFYILHIYLYVDMYSLLFFSIFFFYICTFIVTLICILFYFFFSFDFCMDNSWQLV